MTIFDLHVQIKDQQNSPAFKALVSMAQTLGFSGLALEGSTVPARKLAGDEFQLFRRRTLSPRSAAGLRALVTKHQKVTDLLVIHGRTKPIILGAANLPAVAMVMLRALSDFGVIDSQVARTLATMDKPVELCLNGLPRFSGPQRSRLIRAMTTATDYLLRAQCPLLLTSGATTAYALRSPRDLAALAYLANVPEDIARQGILELPGTVLTQQKLIIQSKRVSQKSKKG